MSESYEKVKRDQDKLPDNEIRVRGDVRIGRYLRRANDLLTGKVEGQDSVVIKGMAKAMQSAVALAELIKHRVKGIHSQTEIEVSTLIDEFEPLYEGLDVLKFERQVTMMVITLTKSPKDTTHYGYQEPIPESEVSAFEERQPGEGRPEKQYRARSSSRGPTGDRGDRVDRGGRGGRGGQRGGLARGFRGGRGGFRGGERGTQRGGQRGGYRSRDEGGDDRREGGAAGYGERRPQQNRDNGYGGNRRPYDNQGRSYGEDTRSYGGEGQRRYQGDKYQGEGQRRPYGDDQRRSYGDDQRRSYGDDQRRPYGDDQRREQRPKSNYREQRQGADVDTYDRSPRRENQGGDRDRFRNRSGPRQEGTQDEPRRGSFRGNRGGQRGGYRGERGGYRDFRGDRDTQRVGNYRGENRGGQRGGYSRDEDRY
eukprot:403349920